MAVYFKTFPLLRLFFFKMGNKRQRVIESNFYWVAFFILFFTFEFNRHSHKSLLNFSHSDFGRVESVESGRDVQLLILQNHLNVMLSNKMGSKFTGERAIAIRSKTQLEISDIQTYTAHCKVLQMT